MLLAEAACHDRLLMDVAHVKSASISHADLVSGKESKRFVFGCNIEFCSFVRRIYGLIILQLYLYLKLLRCGHLDCQPTVRTKGR